VCKVKRRDFRALRSGCCRERLYSDDNGYIVVETIGTFIPFVLIVVSILSLVNIVALQTRVHYAITQAANTLSMYSYVLEVTGVAGALSSIDEKASGVTAEADEMKDNINKVIDGLNSLSVESIFNNGTAALDGIISGSEAVINQTTGLVDEFSSDPKAMLQTLLNYGIHEVGNKLFEKLLRPLVGRYLVVWDGKNGTAMSGNKYLERANVINGLNGLSFATMFSEFDINSRGQNDSVLIDANGDVKIVVRYEVEYKIGNIPLPFIEPKLIITQTVKTKAWLSGSGPGYVE